MTLERETERETQNKSLTVAFKSAWDRCASGKLEPHTLGFERHIGSYSRKSLGLGSKIKSVACTLEKNATDPVLWNDLGVIFRKSGEFSEAMM
jgi:hypothetical protein